MHKIVYNDCYGGFSLSKEAAERLAELGCAEAARELHEHVQALASDDATTQRFAATFGRKAFLRDIVRHDPRLVRVVEELGAKANGMCAKLAIATIQGDRYRIDEYDGSESVVEPNDQDWICIED